MTPLIDEWLPQYDRVERHALVIAAEPAAVWAALWRTDVLASCIVRGLLALRTVRMNRPHGPVTLGQLTLRGFALLGERPEREVLLGTVGRFWSPGGERLTLDAESFRAFDRPGWAKAAWDFRLTPEAGGATRLSTETRVRCLDGASRRRFALYWLAIRPFSGLIRIALLRAIAREATRGAAPSPSRR
jgi:hypothetical protein